MEAVFGHKADIVLEVFEECPLECGNENFQSDLKTTCGVVVMLYD